MEKIENRFLDTYSHNVSWYVRFKDDTFILWNGTDTKFKEFFAYINDLHKSLEFTFEKETKEASINFLDLTVHRIPGSKFCTNIYRKPMAVCRPINFASKHHPSQKWGTLTSGVLRARRLISNQEHLWTELKFLRENFVNQGYPLHIVHKTMLKAMKKDLWPEHSRTTLNEENSKVIYKSAPFVPVVTKQNNKLWNQLVKDMGVDKKIRFSYKPDADVLKRLSNVKMVEIKQEEIKKQSGLVYAVSCNQCEDSKKVRYIGETTRPLKERIYSHMYDRSNPSALRKHKEEEPYHSDFKFRILGKEMIASRRKILESIWIKQLSPQWNADKGLKLYCGVNE